MNNTFSTPSDSFEPTLLPPSADPAQARRDFSRIGLAYAVLTLSLQALATGINYLAYFFAPWILSSWWWTWVISLLPLYGMALPLMWLLLRRIPAAPHNGDYFRYGATVDKPVFHGGHWVLLLIMGFGFMHGGGILGNIIMAILSEVLDYDYANALNTIVEQSPLWATFLGTCICAPLGEELLFRKLLIDRTRRYGDLPSILLSGLLFGLFHGNLFQFFYATAVGMLLAYVYTRTGKYSLCVAMHAAFNFMGSIVTSQLVGLLPEDLISFENLIQPLVYLLLMVWQYGMLIAGIVLFCVLLSRRKLSRGSDPLYRENAASLMLGNVGMILCLVIMGLVMAINLWPMA